LSLSTLCSGRGGRFYSAGRFVRSHDFDAVPIQPWPPDPLSEGWWRPPDDFIRERLREVQIALENADDSEDSDTEQVERRLRREAADLAERAAKDE
jgi:hypothetical protein